MILRHREPTLKVRMPGEPSPPPTTPIPLVQCRAAGRTRRRPRTGCGAAQQRQPRVVGGDFAVRQTLKNTNQTLSIAPGNEQVAVPERQSRHKFVYKFDRHPHPLRRQPEDSVAVQRHGAREYTGRPGARIPGHHGSPTEFQDQALLNPAKPVQDAPAQPGSVNAGQLLPPVNHGVGENAKFAAPCLPIAGSAVLQSIRIVLRPGCRGVGGGAGLIAFRGAVAYRGLFGNFGHSLSIGRTSRPIHRAPLPSRPLLVPAPSSVAFTVQDRGSQKKASRVGFVRVSLCARDSGRYTAVAATPASSSGTGCVVRHLG